MNKEKHKKTSIRRTSRKSKIVAEDEEMVRKNEILEVIRFLWLQITFSFLQQFHYFRAYFSIKTCPLAFKLLMISVPDSGVIVIFPKLSTPHGGGGVKRNSFSSLTHTPPIAIFPQHHEVLINCGNWICFEFRNIRYFLPPKLLFCREQYQPDGQRSRWWWMW